MSANVHKNTPIVLLCVYPLADTGTDGNLEDKLTTTDTKTGQVMPVTVLNNMDDNGKLSPGDDILSFTTLGGITLA